MSEALPFAPAAGAPPLTVATLNRLVRECLESRFPLLWVSGEISNLTYAASGHVYFSLKDAQAQVRCVMWRSRAQTLGWRLQNGQQIEVRALVAFYEPRGEFQLNVEAVRRAGQGDLYERFLRLKAQLENEGLFAVDRKRPLPPFPRHLAIVTSPQAAALRDVLTTLHRRAPQVAVTLVPTLVQGEGAAARIAQALDEAGRSGAEVVLLCRGGGSLEDLWAFNEEAVARAIRACPVPVIAGIGHETDFTIADFAADLRAPTPTAAAELAAPDNAALRQQLDQQARRLQRAQDRHLSDAQQRLDLLAHRLIHPAERLQRQRTALAQLGHRLALAARQPLTQRQLRLDALRHRLTSGRPQAQPWARELQHLHERLNQSLRWQVSNATARVASAARSLRQLDPHAVLARGYALAIGPDGRAVRDASALSSGDALRLSFARGSASATVTQVVAPGEAE